MDVIKLRISRWSNGALLALMIAFILTGPFEESLRQALIGSEGSLLIFFEKPIAAFFLMLAVVMIVSTIWRERSNGAVRIPQTE